MANCAFGLKNKVNSSSQLTGSAPMYTGSAVYRSFGPGNLALDQGNQTAAFWSKGSDTAWFDVAYYPAEPVQAFFIGRTNLGQSATWTLTVKNGDTQVYTATGTFATLGGVGPVQMVHVAPQPIMASDIRFDISANGSVWESYIAISLAYVGPIWQPVRNYSTKSTTGLDLGQTVNTGMAGAEFVTSAYARRKAVVDHESLDIADVPVLEQIALLGAAGSNVLFIPDPAADPPTLNLRTLFGRIQRGDLSNPFGAAARQQTSFTITERL
ncbi:hypothetical protein [Acetobacter indonesiensis]|uniref:Uncharacterized protein n=1 Tax=Acetobacter indonesiensis TaxID=104101 RepID=A0A252AKH8_9PROT|nr:hypothetical protein [Acetobacter indonesiensis]OUI90104.1 hypothetical protein HK17_14265 [Acetobacter indonesiensis]